MMEELQEVASEAVEKVAEEAEASEEGRAGVVEKEEAGEVIAEPPRARARPNVFSKTCLHHISTKKLSPLRSLQPATNTTTNLLVFEPSFGQICLFTTSNHRLVTKTASWRQFHVCV